MKGPIVMLLLLAAVLAVTALFSLGLGAVSIPAGRIVRILGSTPVLEPPATDVTIVWDLRLPRILLAGLIGGGLGAAGAGYQGLFRNPLVDPFVIGASSGAALGATLAIVAGLRESVLGLGAVSAAALSAHCWPSRLPTVSLRWAGRCRSRRCSWPEWLSAASSEL